MVPQRKRSVRGFGYDRFSGKEMGQGRGEMAMGAERTRMWTWPKVELVHRGK